MRERGRESDDSVFIMSVSDWLGAVNSAGFEKKTKKHL